jgi:hypothetical protein
MTKQLALHNLVAIIGAVINHHEAIEEAIRACEEAGAIVRGFNIQIIADLHRSPAPADAFNDSDFLRKLRIAPDLSVTEDGC